MRSIGLLAATGVMVVGGALLLVAVLGGDDDAPVRQLTLQAQEVRSRNPGHPPDEVHLRTKRTELPVGTTEVTIGTCASGQEVTGWGGPTGTPVEVLPTTSDFGVGSKQRSITVTVGNTAQTPVARRYTLICEPRR